MADNDKHPLIDDPVSGWLIIMDGPGRGSSFPLGLGGSTIGRGADADVRIDFGDGAMSSEHADIIYDRKGRRFFVRPLSETNLTYMGDEPLLTPAEIKSGSEFSVGETTLRFISFCGRDFDWTDVA